MATPVDSFDVPYRDVVVERGGLLTSAWSNFMRILFDRVQPLGMERSFQIENDQSDAANIDGLKVNARGVSQAIVDYLVQRVTTGAGATELVESGSFVLVYKPSSESWSISPISADLPDDSGIDFFVTGNGQVQYTSSNITGTASISRVIWRMRTLAAKSAQYSSQGTR